METLQRILVFVVVFVCAYVNAGHVDSATSPHGHRGVKFTCTGDSLKDFRPFARTVTPYVDISECPLPTESYASSLKAINISAGKISRLDLNHLANATLIPGSVFKGLALKELSILNNDEQKMVPLANDFLNPLIPSLKELHLQRVILPPFPQNSRMVYVSLMRGTSTGAWGGCSELRRLDAMHWQAQVVDGWLSHCTKLSELELYHVMEQTVRRALIGAKSVTSLTVRKCALLYLPSNLFTDVVELRKLKFVKHSIYGMNYNVFKHQTKLEEFDFSTNELRDSWELATVLAPLLKLRTLILNHNPLQKFCYSWSEPPLPLERLSLSDTELKQLCFNKWHTLKYLDLSQNNITALEFQNLPSSPALTLEVDLRRNPIRHLPATEEDYHMMVDKFRHVKNVTIYVDLVLECDCDHAWFARGLRALPRLRVVGARCSSGERLAGVRAERLECDKWLCEGCTCRRAWSDNATGADCRDAQLRDVPRVPALRVLHARDNFIDTLQAEDFPDTLMTVDLRDNHVALVSGEAAAALFGNPDRRVRLSGNPLVCDCANQLLIKALHRHREQVEDFDNITCVGDDSRALSDVLLDDLCDELLGQMWPVIVALTAVTAVLSLAIALYCRYEHKIKVYLYTRGYCLSCLPEEKIDADREFDAFVSFCHADDQFVQDSLLPGLTNYKLCIHYRDWIAGEWIPAQIARSIEQSRRTILVLSRNYLQSVWGMLEFRMAHASTLQEGRPRLIAVVLDDVVDDPQLDAELRGYLASNTYIKFSDPWFFEKLWYSLPISRKREQYKDAVARKGLKIDCDLSISSKIATYGSQWQTHSDLHPI